MQYSVLLVTSLLALGSVVFCIDDEDKRDCYPWDDISQSACEARGCIWEESATPGIPWCFYDPYMCPSQIEEAERQDCCVLCGDPITRDQCLQTEDCVWCETETEGVPWCFVDPSVSMGGPVCPDDIATTERIDCHPDPVQGDLQEECLNRGCYYCESEEQDVPWCFMPRSHGYRQTSREDHATGFTIGLERVQTPSWIGGDLSQLKFDVAYHTDERLQIKIVDAAEERFQVPGVDIPPGTPTDNRLYDVEVVTDPVFAFRVVRRSNGAVIFDTTIGGLVFADQFIQLASYLNTDNFYGLGEQEHHSMRHDVNWKTWAMWARDLAVTTENLYGVQPVYMNIEEDSSAHMVLIKNANAQEVLLMPHPALTYRTIGGVLDLYFFLGPTVDQLYSQYTEAVGRPPMVPYWMLGFQLCRWGYEDLDHMQAAVNRMRQYDIPHDIQYGDIDYMEEKRDFTIDPINFAGLPEYVEQLKAEGTRFVIILDPAIAMFLEPGEYPPLDEGNRLDVWVKDHDGTPYIGEVWPGLCYYPDYSRESTYVWWSEEIRKFQDELEFGAIWIDMNEPSNFIHGREEGCSNIAINKPLFVPDIESRLEEKTFCMEAVDDISIHYNSHSLYGHNMAIHTKRAVDELFEERSVVFSRSTYPGSGHYGQHWLGDNYSRWSNLRWSIIGMLEFNMFGIPYTGADICGFNEHAEEEMCLRWQQLGAFYTFSRNHNAEGNPDQDPGIWPEVARVTRETLHIRYNLLPYLYTLFYRAHQHGTGVLRPLYYNFQSDEDTYDVSDQFMWGDGLLISPVLDQGAVTVTAYIPDARWYSYYSGAELDVRGVYTTLPAPLDFIPLHIKGGVILPTQTPSNSTLFSRQLPMGLIVALDDSNSATGELFWDDGVAKDLDAAFFIAEYSFSQGVLTNTNHITTYDPALTFDHFRIFGYTDAVTSVVVNDVPIDSYTVDPESLELHIFDLTLNVGDEFTVQIL